MVSPMSRVTIVTGASRGIGAATALLAASHGDAVCVNYAHDAAAAGDVVQRIADAGGTAIAICADVAHEADVVRLFAEVDGTLGTVGLLVNNAGVAGDHGPVERVTAGGLERVLAVNVTGAFLCAREAVRRMSTGNGGHGGAIVNVSSRAAELGGAGEWVAYAATKGAIDTMTIGLAREVAALGIRVNAVSPGLIDTEFHDIAPGRLERLTPMVPMGRAGTADEVAEAIMWLASDASGYVTGSRLDVSGGR
jgi:NAD(P)-dependent dehydrogenase (short-subunit alcohol dehydrogenase family)